VSPAPTFVARLDALINRNTVVGARYNDVTQQDIDTETFAGGGPGVNSAR